MEAKDERNVDWRLKYNHVFIDEYKVVKGDKADNSNEMGVDQSTAHMNN